MTADAAENNDDDRKENKNNEPTENNVQTEVNNIENGAKHAEHTGEPGGPPKQHETKDVEESSNKETSEITRREDNKHDYKEESNYNQDESTSYSNTAYNPIEDNLDSNSSDTKVEMSKDFVNENQLPDTESEEKQNQVEWINNDTKIDRKMSNYLHNITISGPNLGLTLSNADKKETNLLTESKTVVRFSPLWKQSLAAAAGILLTVASGLTSGYSAILLPQLRAAGSPVLAGPDTPSWIAAMAALPMAPGCLISGWMMERFGRRASLYFTCVPLFVGWLLIAGSYNVSLMLAGRFLTGACVGLVGPLCPVYIAETTDPKYRGFFLAVVALAVAVGIMIVQLVGTFLTWQWTAIVCCIFPLVSLVPLTVIPESPTWLIAKGRLEDGVKAFYWLRGYDNDAKIELKAIIDSKKSFDNEPKMNWKEKLLSLRSPALLKPLVIMITFFVTGQFSGVNAVAFYSIEIVEKAVGTGIDHYSAMLAIDALRVVMSVVACVLSKKYGRRILCFVSGIWTAISMVGLAMFLYWRLDNMPWLPLTCLMLYICAISIGLVPLPWIMCGEVFPTRVRGLGSGISTATAFVAFFAVVKTAPGMMAHFGDVTTFLTYGVISLVGTVIMYFILPETKGKSLQEIEAKFNRRRNSMLFC